MKRRRLKITLSLVLGLSISYLLTLFVFYPSAPLIRSEAKVKQALFLIQLKEKSAGLLKMFSKNEGEGKESAETPPPWYFELLPNYPTPRNYPTLPPMGGGGLVYPTDSNYPTHNPERRITPIPPPDVGTPTITQKPIFDFPTSIPTQPPGKPPSGSAEEMLSLINEQRKKEGASPLKFNQALNEAAQLHADTVTKCGHYGPDGSSPFDRVVEAGYPTSGVGENISCGTDAFEQAFNAWMNSPPHHANMVNKSWVSAGLGTARGYWVFVGGPI